MSEIIPGYEGIALAMENITKIYNNGFIANKDVTLIAKTGEILGLVGENGAGKTTLMKVLFGQETPEEGRIVLHGKEVKINNPLEALDYGIGMVHQHFMLINELTVAENMVLSSIPVIGKIKFDLNKARQMTLNVAKKYNLPIDPDAIVGDLSVGMKQRVEILKILLRDVRILLFDEPTAVLTPQETEELFIQLKGLKQKGFTIIFISHKLNEIKQICDRITVLRKGRVVATKEINEVSISDISALMVGRNISLDLQKKKSNPGKPVLIVKRLNFINKVGKKTIDDVSFSVRKGEILGVAAVEGNGQTELGDILMGLLENSDGEILMDDKRYPILDCNSIRKLGVSMVHEDRMIYGTSVKQSIYENLTSDRISTKPYKKNGIIDFKYIANWSNEQIQEYTIKCDGYKDPVQTLSGGNIQKVVAAREFTSNPKLLVVSQPTRGIDVGATEIIRKKIISLRDDINTAVILFSADLAELLAVSDRIIVMFEGKIVAHFESTDGLNEEILGEYMLGIKKHSLEQIGGAYIV